MVRVRSLSASESASVVKQRTPGTPFQTRTRSMASRPHTPNPVDSDSEDEVTFRVSPPQGDPPEGEANPQAEPRIHNPHSTSPNNPPAEQQVPINQPTNQPEPIASTSTAHINQTPAIPAGNVEVIGPILAETMFQMVNENLNFLTTADRLNYVITAYRVRKVINEEQFIRLLKCVNDLNAADDVRRMPPPRTNVPASCRSSRPASRILRGLSRTPSPGESRVQSYVDEQEEYISNNQSAHRRTSPHFEAAPRRAHENPNLADIQGSTIQTNSASRVPPPTSTRERRHNRSKSPELHPRDISPISSISSIASSTHRASDIVRQNRMSSIIDSLNSRPINIETSDIRVPTPHPSTGQFTLTDLDVNGQLMNKLANAIDRMAAVNEPKNRKASFPDHLKHFTGREGYQHAISWFNKLKIFKTTNTSTEEEILMSIRDVFEADSPASMWFEARGKSCKNFIQLEAAFKKTYGPNADELCELKIQVRSQKQQHSQSFVAFSHQIMMLNQELGAPYDDAKLLKLIQRNMLPRYRVKVEGKPFNNLEELEDKVSSYEKQYLMVEISNLEGKGHTVGKIQTVEQLFDFQTALNKPIEPPQKPAVFQPKSQSADQRAKSDSNSSNANQGRNPPKPLMEVKVNDSKPLIKSDNSTVGSTTTSNASKRGGNFRDRNDRGEKRPFVPREPVALFDPSKCRNLDRNLTGFDGDVEKLEGYRYENQCWSCGLRGFRSSECPRCKTEEEIAQFRSLTGPQKRDYFDNLRKQNEARREAWRNRTQNPVSKDQPKLSEANSEPLGQKNEGWGNN